MYMAPGRLLSPIASGGGPAGLDISFLGPTAATLDSRITYSRSGMAYRYDTTGVYTTAAHNLVTNSQDFENSAWTKNQCAITGNVIAEPLTGTITGDLITGTSSTISVTQNVTITSGARVVVAVYVQPATTNWARLRLQSGAETASQYFNVATGATGTGTSTASIVISSPTATSVGSGWYRISAIFSTAGITTLSVGVGATAADNNAGTTGDSAYIWGYQAETHTALRTYLPTSTKNLAGFSQEFDNAAWAKTFLTVTANAATDPFGTVYADKLVPALASNNQFLVQTISYTANTSYTQSVYAKASGYSWLRMSFPNPPMASGRQACFDLTLGTVTGADVGVTTSITAMGDGWYRCAMTATATTTASGTTGLTVNGANTAAVAAIAGDGTSGILVYGAMVGSSGSLDTYSPNVAAAPTSAAYYGARFDHDPVTLDAKGLLIEEARTNLLLNSANLGISPWASNNLSTRLPWAGLAPDGTWSASLLEDGSTSVAGYTDQSVTVANDSAWYVFSVYIKAGTSDLCHVRAYITGGAPNLGTGIGANFTFSTATLGAPSGAGGQGAASATDAGVTSVGNGWYRLYVRMQNNTSANTSFTCRVFPQNTSTAAVGNIYAWGAQLEIGTFPTTYIPTIPSWTARAGTATYHDVNGVLQTAASGVARVGYGYNGTSWVRTGPINELASTNLQAGDLTNTTNWPAVGTTRAGSTSAPDGTTNAVTVTELVSGTSSYGVNSVTSTITASAACNASIYAKAGTCSWLRLILCDAISPTIGIQAWYNVSTGVLGTVSSQASTGGTPSGWAATITNVGGGFYRCTLSGTLATATTGFVLLRMVSGDGATTDTVGGKTMSFWGPQLELGVSPTSYIPTTSASASRVADSFTSASATRNADIALIAPLGNYVGAAEGTVLAEVQLPYQTLFATTAVAFGVADGTINQSIYLSNSATSDVANVVNGGVAQASISNSSPPLTIKKFAGAYKVNDFAFCRNGGAVSTDTSGTIPTGLIQGGVGKAAWSNANYLNGYLRRVKVYDRRLPNAVLQMITTP